MELPGYPQFEACVKQYYKSANETPLAYTPRYGGYRYRISANQLPDGTYLYDPKELKTWLAEHPEGFIISELHQKNVADKQVFCQSPVIDTKQFILWQQKQS